MTYFDMMTLIAVAAAGLATAGGIALIWLGQRYDELVADLEDTEKLLDRALEDGCDLAVDYDYLERLYHQQREELERLRSEKEGSRLDESDCEIAV